MRTPASWGVLGVLVGAILMASAATARAEEEKADVVVYGGTPAGIAAAVAARREGASVLLLEQTRHVGGLHTSGLTTAEWAQNWDTFSGLLEEFFRRLGKAYGAKDAKYQWESKVAERVYLDMLREAKVAVRFEKQIDRAEKRDGRLVSIAMTDGSVFRGRVLIDASYEGDLLARAGVSYALGREGRDQYGEDLAGIRLDPKFGDNDHWPYYVYVREARRMVGAYVMTQRDIQAERDKADTIALGSHWLDSHHVQRVAISKTELKNEGRFWVDQGKRPYEIPYRSLVPKREECDNLLVPVCLSASHVAFSSVRVEETWMMLGQAAGTAAAMSASRGTAAQEVDVPALQGRLRVTGLRIDRGILDPDSKRPSATVGQEPPRPPMTEGEPVPGKFVRQVAPEYRGTGVYHALYLPTNWKPGGTCPVIVEYATNRWEELTGKVEDCRLGFHLSGGKDSIWIVMPYVDPVKKENVLWWWGDEKATVEYCLATLRRVCETYGGDPNAVLFAGFSRGAIAASYLGLRDEGVADVWLAFLPHSHIDGGRFTPEGARERLARTRGRATFITYGSDDDGKNESPKGAAILRELGFPVVERELAGLKHTDRFLEKDSPIRREMRQWIAEVLKSRPGTHAVHGRVVDGNGKGIAGVRVQCGTWHWTVTGADGGYVIPSLVPGRRRLSATKDGFALAPAEREVVIEGQEVDAEPFMGTPVAGR